METQFQACLLCPERRSFDRKYEKLHANKKFVLFSLPSCDINRVNMKHKQAEQSGLLPSLGLFTTISIVVGAVIGSGIFAKPAVMADKLGSPELIIIIWIAAGLITLFGALTNAEVAGMMPATGGQYIFFREMYGDFYAYLYGWSMFIVVQSASIAAITYIFSMSADAFLHLPHLSDSAEQFALHIPLIGDIFPLKDIGVKGLTIVTILFLSGVNYIGVRLGGIVQSIFTTLKVAALMVIVVLAFTIGDGSFANFTQDTLKPMDVGLFAGIIGALTAAFWAYDGWNNITYIAGEVKNPQRTIPVSLMVGTLIIMAVYIIFNLGVMYVMPIDDMRGKSLIAVDATSRIFSQIDPTWAVFGFGFVTMSIMISTFGTSNGTIMVTARLYFAMARNNLFFKPLGDLHTEYLTPHKSLLVQAVWSSVLVMTGTFDMLTDMLVFVQWIAYAMGAYGVFILRKRLPDVPRPYKVWGYPYIPAIFVIFASAFVVLILYNDISGYINGTTPFINSVFGLLLVSTGIPLYYRFKNRPHTQQ